MKSQEIYDQYFGEFEKWLKSKGLEATFSMDVKMSKVFDMLYQEYSQQVQYNKAAENIFNAISIDNLKDIIKEREKLESKKIITPNLKIVGPSGK